MKSCIRYILPLALGALMLSACTRSGKMIPPKKMAEVYADMFIADQWVYSWNLKRQADSVAIYEPIFEKWGYTVEDFRYSVDKYMDDADRFMKVMQDTKFILQCRLKEVDDRWILQHKQDSLMRALAAKAVQINLFEVEGDSKRDLLKEFFPMLPVDSLLIQIGEKDHFAGPLVLEVPVDTLENLPEKDSLSVIQDTVPVITPDSLFVKKLDGVLKITSLKK